MLETRKIIFLLILLNATVIFGRNVIYYGRPETIKGEYKINRMRQIRELLIADYQQL
jgi:hypothetical protein